MCSFLGISNQAQSGNSRSVPWTKLHALMAACGEFRSHPAVFQAHWGAFSRSSHVTQAMSLADCGHDMTGRPSVFVQSQCYNNLSKCSTLFSLNVPHSSLHQPLRRFATCFRPSLVGHSSHRSSSFWSCAAPGRLDAFLCLLHCMWACDVFCVLSAQGLWL